MTALGPVWQVRYGSQRVRRAVLRDSMLSSPGEKTSSGGSDQDDCNVGEN